MKIFGIYTKVNHKSMAICTEAIESHIPYYLTQEQKEGLTKALSDFKEHPINYYINRYAEEMLQGDGWHGLDVIRLEDGARNKIKGIVLSNTCDINPGNKRNLPAKITFAPIIKLSNYADLLRATGLERKQIDGKFKAIREQSVTTLFYLPPCDTLDDEYIALLDDIHSIPARTFASYQEREKLFTLSMVGFYLFLLKLSIHFCRFHEEVER